MTAPSAPRPAPSWAAEADKIIRAFDEAAARLRADVRRAIDACNAAAEECGRAGDEREGW